MNKKTRKALGRGSRAAAAAEALLATHVMRDGQRLLRMVDSGEVQDMAGLEEALADLSDADGDFRPAHYRAEVRAWLAYQGLGTVEAFAALD